MSAGKQSTDWTRAQLWRRKLLYPGHTLPTAAAPVAVAVGLAVHERVLDIPAAVVALVAGWLIQLGGVLADNYGNLVREPDDREHPELVRALRKGTLTLPGLRNAVIGSYAVSLVSALYLISHAGLGVLVIGVLGVIASLSYSAGPFPLGRHALSDPLFFLFFGVISVFGAYYVQAAPAFGATLGTWIMPGAIDPLALLLGVPVGALITGILIVDDIRDYQFDRLKGKRTIAVRFGRKWSRAEFIVLQGIAYVMPLLHWREFGAWVLLPWLTLPFAVSTARDVLRKERYEELLPTTPKAGRLVLAFSVLLAIGVGMR